jgi:hypothetical protein
VVDCILKRLARFLEQRGRPGLAGRQFHAGDVGGMVHALDQDRPPAVVDHSDNSGQMIARCLRFGSGDDLSRNLEGQHLLLRELRGRNRW